MTGKKGVRVKKIPMAGKTVSYSCLSGRRGGRIDRYSDAAREHRTQEKKQSPLVFLIHFPETAFQFLTIATASRIL